jgi:RNA-directed DNA polymerase
MTKASRNLQELRRKIYRKAKTEKHWRFWGLYGHICKKEVLQEAYRLAKANDGVPGIDYKSFEDIEDGGVEGFLEGIRQDLLNRTYKPMPNKRVEIPMLKLILKANGKKGVPQGGVISPLLSNLYLNAIDEMMERAREATRRNGYYNLDFIRSADDMVVLIHRHPAEDWLLNAVQKRLREEFDKLDVQMNQEKTKVVNLKEGGSFGFLGFDFRLSRNREGKDYVSKTRREKKVKEIVEKIKAALKAKRNEPLNEVIQTLNAIIRGWVNYFRIGNSSRTFCKVRDYIEKKVRRFVMRRKKLKGFGWELWSKKDIYQKWGLFYDYRIEYIRPKAASAR